MLTQIIIISFSTVLTYLFAKYELMHRNSPEKMQIAYDKFYYPALIWGEKINRHATINNFEDFSKKLEKK